MWDMIGVFLNDETVFKESEEELEAETEETVRLINEQYRGIPRDMIIPGAIIVYSGENVSFGAYEGARSGMSSGCLFRKTASRCCLSPLTGSAGTSSTGRYFERSIHETRRHRQVPEMVAHDHEERAKGNG